MPVIIPNGYEEQWTEQVTDSSKLKRLLPIMMGWPSDGWIVEDVKVKNCSNEFVLNEILMILRLENPFITGNDIQKNLETFCKLIVKFRTGFQAATL